jgi:amino acid transporter
MIGSGIFRVPAVAATTTGEPTALLLVWVAGGLVAMCGALALAEVAALYPDAGGMYVYLREAYGPLTAFLFGWLYLIIMPTGAGAIALVFAEYLGRLIPLGPGSVRIAAVALIILLAAAQYRSVQFGAAIQNASTVAKVAAILAMVAAAFALGAPGAGAWSGTTPPAPVSLSGFGLGVVAALWAYNGWQDVTCLSGEVRDPGRSLPRAIVGGTLTVVVIYLLVNLAYLRVLSIDEIARSPLVAADLAVRLAGPVGTALIAALVCVSTFGSLNAVIMATPRVFWAMAADGLFFRRVGAVHPRYQTPHVAIMALAGLAVVYVTVQSFEWLVEAFVLASLPFWALSVASVIVLRRRRPDLPRTYRTPGYPVVPLLFVAAMLALVGNSFREHPETTGVSLGAIVAGIPLFYYWRRRANVNTGA